MAVFKIFLLNLISDIDNGFVLSSILRKYNLHRRKYIFIAFYAALILTFTRTFYVLIEKHIEDLPGLRLISGLILLWIAIRMAVTSTSEKRSKLNPFTWTTLQISILLILTDFAICLDSVIMTAALSENPVEIAFGIFMSLFIILFFFRNLLQILSYAPWIQIFVAGFLAQIAVMQMSHDPVMQHMVHKIQLFFMDPEGSAISKIMDFIALDVALLVVLVGFVRRSLNKS